MYKIFYTLVTIIWIFDIFNLNCVNALDTIYPINGLEWLLIWFLLPYPEDSKDN